MYSFFSLPMIYSSWQNKKIRMTDDKMKFKIHILLNWSHQHLLYV